MNQKPERLRKSEALNHWKSLAENTSIKMRKIPYRFEGSRYGMDGIRIDGSREFIDSVLSRLKDLTSLENGETRLEINYCQVTDKETRQPRPGEWVCSIRNMERGPEAQHVNRYLAAVTGRADAHI